MGDRRGKNKEIHYAKHLKTPFCSQLGPHDKMSSWLDVIEIDDKQL